MIDGKKVLLLVEDSEIVRELTRAALEEAGYLVRTAAGNADLENRIRTVAGFLEGIDLIVLDMELQENLERYREDKHGRHVASHMTGSQIGAALTLTHPQLGSVPFLVYSGKERSEIQAYLDELAEFAKLDEGIRSNYKGFVPKLEGGEAALLEKVDEILAG